MKFQFIGDSITDGDPIHGGFRETALAHLTNYGYDPEFVGTLSKGTFSQPQHDGHTGARIDTVEGMLYDILSPFIADVLVVLLGINDCASKYHNGAYRMDRFIYHANAIVPSAKILVGMLGPFLDGDMDRGRLANEHNLALPSIVARWSCARLLYSHSWLNPTELGDGVHPSDPTGYAVLGSLLAREIHEVLSAW